MDIKEKTKDSCITMIRITATIMIVICHLCTWLGYSVLGLVFDVGVQIFFFVSGWCYSEKVISQPSRWLLERWRKLCVPAYVWTATMLLIRYFIGGWQAPLWQYVLTYGLNLQGWEKVFPLLRLDWIVCVSECGPMWFLTALMLCYVLMLLVKGFAWNCTKKTHLWIYMVGGGICVCVAAFFGVCLEWFYVFFLGYFSKKIWRKVLKRQYVLITLCMIASMVVRLLGKYFLDGTIWYDSIIVYLTHNVLALWFIATIRWINQESNMINRILSTVPMQWLDKYQYEVYLVHYGLLFTTSLIVERLIARIIVFVVMVIVSSMVLRRVSIVKVKNENYKKH